jgi:hypothetical protein
MISLAPCLAALCAAAAPQPKTSDVVGVLAVSPPPGPGPALVDVAGMLRDELAKRIDGVFSARDLKDRMADYDQAMASLSDLDRAYSSAVDSAKRDPALAIRWLRGILAELERLPGGAEVYEQWTRANLRLARMRLEYVSSPEEGESGVREARQIVERVLRLQQHLKLDPSLFPRRVIALVEEARAGLAKAPLRKLAVRSAVEGVKVFVDGKEEGLAPLTLQVPAGIYRVSGTRGSLRSPAAMADAREADAAVSLDFTLLASFRPAQGPGLAAPEPEQESKILQSASALGLDRVVAASLVEQKNTFLFASMTSLEPGGSASARQGWIRLSPRGLTPEVAQEMADYLATGQAKGDITPLAPDAEKAKQGASARNTARAYGARAAGRTGELEVAVDLDALLAPPHRLHPAARVSALLPPVWLPVFPIALAVPAVSEINRLVCLFADLLPLLVLLLDLLHGRTRVKFVVVIGRRGAANLAHIQPPGRMVLDTCQRQPK